MSCQNSFDFKLYQGTTTKFQLQFQNDAEEPLDLTGYCFASEVRSKLGDLIMTLQFNILDQSVTDNLGKVEMTVPLDQQEFNTDEVGTTLFYDVKAYRTGLEEEILKQFSGEIFVIPSQTKAMSCQL